jgi:RimJ/RimL family protein N-acetyltransferase
MQLIRSERLILEPQVAAHAEAMFDVLADPAIYEYENDPPASVASLRKRFQMLEMRRSPDGREQWLNWVLRLRPAQLIGYVQATLHADASADVAYVLASDYWGRGLASEAVNAMIGELVEHYRVRTLRAVFKRDNHRSMRLLERLQFTHASPEEHARHRVEPDERLMHRTVGGQD